MFDKCFAQLDTTVGGRELSKSEVRLLQKEFTREYLEQAKQGAAYAESVQMAAEKVKNRLTTEQAVKDYQAFLQANAMQRTLDFVEANKMKFGSGGEALLRVLVYFSDSKSGTQSIDIKTRGIMEDASRYLNKIYDAIGTEKAWTVENAANRRMFVEAMYGKTEGIPPEIIAAAKTWQELSESLRLRRNEVGGNTNKLESWNMPQKWSERMTENAWRRHPDAAKVEQLLKERKFAGKNKRQEIARQLNKMAQDVFVNDFFPHIDRTKEVYFNDDGTPFSDAELRKFLSESFLTIYSNGANKHHKQGTVGALKNRQRAERQIHIKDADGYNFLFEHYGDGSLMHGLQIHTEIMAKDIALMDTFGGDPLKTIEFVSEKLRQEASRDLDKTLLNKEKALEKRNIGALEWMLHETGVPPQHGIFNVMRAFRNVMSLKLGSAYLSSFVDNATMRVQAALFKGSQLQLVLDQAKRLNPLDNSDRELLKQLGLATEYHIRNLVKDAEDIKNTGYTGFAATMQMRLSLLPKATNARREISRQNIASALGHKLKTYAKYEDIKGSDKELLDGYGFNEDVFQVLKLSELRQGSFDANLVDPQNVYAIPDSKIIEVSKPRLDKIKQEIAAELAALDAKKQTPSVIKTKKLIKEQAPDRIKNEIEKIKREAVELYLGMAHLESEMAVLEPSWRTKSKLRFGTRRDTGGGLFVDSVMQFKQFPAAVIMQLYPRALAFSKLDSVKYTSLLVGSMLMMGALVVQIKQLLAGKDLRDMEDRRFWVQAFLAGGAAGAYGDFLFSKENSMGRTLGDYFMGPSFGTATSVFDALKRPITNTAEGEDAKWETVAADLMREVRSATPMTQLWYTKTAFDHMVMYPMQEELAPGYLRRIEKKSRKMYGQEYFWRPDEVFPHRMPEM